MPEWVPRHRRPRHVAALYTLGTAAALLVIGAAWSLVTVLMSDDTSSELPFQPETTSTPGGPDDTATVRYNLWIPRLGVRAPVVELESNDDRVLEPPEDPLLAGWWRDGAMPGDANGSVLIVGHAADGEEAVFTEISSLRAGDMVMLSDPSRRAYRVSLVDAVTPDELARQAEDLFGRGGPARLILVTCDGWDGDEYESNIVVTAEPL